MWNQIMSRQFDKPPVSLFCFRRTFVKETHQVENIDNSQSLICFMLINGLAKKFEAATLNFKQ